jgi:isopentenyl-diphosphate delta-isomerase
MEEVILVDINDEQVGTMEKMEAHLKGVLHRAFSVFIFNAKGEMLLQQRAITKYHSGGLWTNACCSHPRPGEEIGDAAKRRLQEELGFVTPLKKAFSFSYETAFDNGLTENEFDHVYIGGYDGKIFPIASEVQDYCFKKMSDISASLESHGQKYTSWFHLAYPKVEQWLQQHKA